MKWLKLLPLCLAGCFLNISMVAEAAPFEIEENFDDSSLFPDDQQLPTGWAQYSTAWRGFMRKLASDTSYGAHSGSYMFGISSANNNDVFYTAPIECAAGKPYTIEFVALTPGATNGITGGIKIYVGTTQNVEDMTLLATTEQAAIKEWKEFKYSYTPETEGEYCFAIQIYHPGGMNNLGAAFFDDFIFSGNSPEDAPVTMPDPNPDNLADCVEMPYLEEFEGENYLDQNYVPDHWLTTGDAIWRTANVDGLPARSGSWYLIAPDNNAERNQHLYTPFFNLQKDVTYTLTFYTHFEGTYVTSTGQWLSTTMHVTVGTEQDGDFHPLTLASISRNEDDKAYWGAESVTFTPAVSGPYCFCFKLEGPAYSGYVAMEDFYISSPNDVPRPIANFNMLGTFSWVDNTALATTAAPLRLLNTSRYAEDAEWDLGNLKYNALPDGSADVFFTQSGKYTLKLTASNVKGSRTAIKEYGVTVIDKGISYTPMLPYDPGAVTYFERGSIPCYDTDPNDLDYVSGFNHYYRRMAQRYTLPAGAEFTITNLSVWLTNMRYCPIQDDTKLQQNEPFSISFYGCDEHGNLDESKLLGRHSTTMAGAFGSINVGGMAESRNVKFDTPIKVSGTIYVAFEFSDNMKIDVDDEIIGRSFFSLGMVRHQHEQTSLHAKLTAVPEGSTVTADGSWYPVDVLHEQAKGFGLNIQLWADAAAGNESIAIDTLGNAAFAVMNDNGILTVSGTSEGEYVAVYDMTGNQVAIARGCDGVTTIDCTGLGKGIYLVSANAGSARFAR